MLCAYITGFWCYGRNSTDVMYMNIVVGFGFEPHVRGTDGVVLEVVFIIFIMYLFFILIFGVECRALCHI